jgi:hypothetical protein
MTNEHPTLGGTYFGRALADDAAPAGRFAKAPARVTGTEPIVELLATPEWLRGPQPGTEPPLGVAVDELPDMQTIGDRP